jgi:hypothetical protein
MPVPDPMAPKQSAKIEIAPMQAPPKAAAVGMYLLRCFTMDSSLIPSTSISFSINYLAISLELDPDISIQILEKNAQDVSMKVV